MKTNVYCRTTARGIQSFYLEAEGESHYLFSQKFRRGVAQYFTQGVCIDAAMDFSRAHRDTAIIHTMKKLSTHIKYAEKEYGIVVLRQTFRKNTFLNKKAA